MARTTVLVLLLTDFILDVDVALDKFFCSSGPKVLGFELDLPRLRVVLPVEKRALIIESLTELSRKASTAPVQLVEKTLGRLVWASSIFHRLRSQLRPFFGVIKAIEPKSKERGAVKRRRVRRIRIGSSLAEAASYIKGILDNVTASPFPGLVPSLGEERAVIMCDASTKAAGGAIVSEDGRKIEWYHMDFTCAEVQAIIADYIPSFRVGDRPESGHMCFLELLSAVVGILSRPEDQMVLVMCDNSAAVNALCKLYAKSAALNKLMRLLTMSRPSLTTPLMKAIHVEGVSNVVADTISRAGYTVTRNMWSGFDDVKELRIDKILRSIRQPIAAKWL
ncbi:hypothetical protein Pmar_PMAR013962 [Perkinsus marinus ATCC 50983]|uniref:RNase H type-1 domain-containing protein n=1 Tax=Perkinsus marinus (strain ATCC 50983 / TXsc) TaxID=423536 RepID=C5LGE2_PERM5|nr:hypothetical protein Pmar_PMAR013962 [Perkinsus marinus ATCC 50983]EER04189.1 hypothetical protein Pmar_PMAR013962 [Perkinsus marinus ATCC 50983]|eukprot:XP_002772373.1 hypothetical protein Pmar_PMAR013962 [Perkinsus marinus ATCC 50983]